LNRPTLEKTRMNKPSVPTSKTTQITSLQPT